MAGIPWSEVTPRELYLNRRQFLAAAGFAGLVKSPFSTGEKRTPRRDAAAYNNFYEFGTDKADPARNAHTLRTSPWTLSLEAAGEPRLFDIDTLRKLAPLEERVYRLRCVEGWSMVVPWIGFPLSVLLKQAPIPPKAAFVAFQSLYDAGQMPAARYAGIPFPYVEGLRLDEAMHPLTLLCFGMYGDALPNQNGAPVRLVVPWKYGFKSIKSITRVRFVEEQPPSTWVLANPREYGFYSNVNPAVDHPRWSQAKERRLGEFFKRDTLPFNGYGDQVAGLYAGMDLRKHY